MTPFPERLLDLLNLLTKGGCQYGDGTSTADDAKAAIEWIELHKLQDETREYIVETYGVKRPIFKNKEVGEL